MKTTILTAIMSAIILTGCGTDSDNSSFNGTDVSAVQYGEFKVYEKVDFVPNASCDIHTKLVLTNGINGPVVILENAVSGACEVYVAPNLRTFALQEVQGSCGTRHFVGAGVDVIDNRARNCEDRIAADIVVKEKTTKLAEILLTTIFYSQK